MTTPDVLSGCTLLEKSTSRKISRWIFLTTRVKNCVELVDPSDAASKVRIHGDGMFYQQMSETAWMETYQDTLISPKVASLDLLALAVSNEVN